MQTVETDTLLFFSGHERAFSIFRTFEQLLYDSFPMVHKRVQKTQITYFNRHVFSCVSFARVCRKADMPKDAIVLTFGLPVPLDSPRIAAKTQIRPGRWTHHLVLNRPEEMDSEFMAWLRAAYAFSDSPGKSASSPRPPTPLSAPAGGADEGARHFV